MNHAFREDGLYISTSLLQWFLRNAFLKNKLGNIGLCTRAHTYASHRNDMVLLLHKKLQESQRWFFSSTEGKNSSNKWFCVKRRLPSHLKLNIRFSRTVSKAKDMMHWSCNTEAGTCIFTHQPSDWPLDSNPSSCWNKLNQKPPVLLRKGSWPPDNNVFPPLCTRPGGGDHYS